jgi:eukaryotic-like serine/threonine-protein kinase
MRSTPEAPQAAHLAWIGRTLGDRYRITRLIGHGGMGAVFEAHDEGPEAGGRFAVKILDREWSKDEVVVARFAREARAASAVDSQRIVRVHDGGTEDGCPYLVMDLVAGEDLGARLRRRRRLGLDEALQVIEQVLEGVVAAHAAGIVHRDLKPDNVLLSGDAADPDDGASSVTIVDFGMSKIDRTSGGTVPRPLTGKGVVLGTPLYMSPEQAKASTDVDGRSDVYSTGAILFECLTGRPPHTGETHEQVMLRICLEDAPDVRRWAPEVPDVLASVVSKALARERDARFATADEMLAAVRAVGRVGTGDARRVRRRARTRVAVAAVIAMLAGAVVTLLAVALAGR